jgi:hypothetical protein
MRASLALTLLAAPAFAGGIDEIRVADGDGEVRLRADGTAERHYRGRLDNGRLDEPAGWYAAKLDPRDFGRLAALPGAERFADLKDHRLPFPRRVVRLTVVRDGRERTLEMHDRRTDRDPDPPADLWTHLHRFHSCSSSLRRLHFVQTHPFQRCDSFR